MTTRVGGLASGIDTDTIINALIEAKKGPITTLEDKITEENDEYTAWDDVDTKVQELQDVADELFNYSLWKQMSATSTNEDVCTATTDTSAVEGTYSIALTSVAKAHRASSDAQASTSAALGYSGTFTINGADITVSSSDTLTTIMNSINTAAADMDDPVEAYLLGKTLVIQRAATGTGSMTVSESGADNSVLRNLGVLVGTPGDAGDYSTLKNELQPGSNLSATVNGVAVESSSNEEVTDVITGVTLKFYADGEGETSTLTIDRDSESIYSYLEDFIDVYNDTIDYLRSMGAAEVDENSGTLTSVGMLQGDSLIATMLNKLNSIVGSANKNPNVDQDYNSLYKIGIWFEDEDSSDSDNETGHLEIYDKDLLENTLDYHMDELEDLFRAYSDNNNPAGIMRQLVGTDGYLPSLTDSADGSITYKKSFLASDIDEKSDEIDELYSRLNDYETQLWEHFAWMEDTVSSLQSQLSYITAMS